VGTSRKPAANPEFRRPCAGFHPQIYAHENSDRYDIAVVNPLAHFIRSGKPEGPWQHQVIAPQDERLINVAALRTGLHGHFHYSELAAEFLRKLSRNRIQCDLMLSTDTEAKANILRNVTANYRRGKVTIRIVPNRGRDIGSFLTAFDDMFSGYDVVGHVHSKRSSFDIRLGETWREFLGEHLLGNLNPMVDIIVAQFAADNGLGLIFAEDPYLSDWDDNLDIAEALAQKIGIKTPLHPFFEFPNGTMFWSRPAALKHLFNLRLGWDDYPEEPLPYDGTILHAIERLLPLVVRHAGYRFATTHIPGVIR
jgi:lipopolysaccharide biosynthesis protein